MAWEENSRICLHMQLIAILSRIGVKNKREKRKTVQWLEMKKQKRDALERTSLNGYDE